jgi:hypothetical protein
VCRNITRCAKQPLVLSIEAYDYVLATTISRVKTWPKGQLTLATANTFLEKLSHSHLYGRLLIANSFKLSVRGKFWKGTWLLQ